LPLKLPPQPKPNDKPSDKVCVICGQPVTSYSSDPRENKYEKKWGVHWACYLNISNLLDRETGIVTERKSRKRR